MIEMPILWILGAAIVCWVVRGEIDPSCRYRNAAALAIAAIWPAVATIALIVMVVDAMTGARRQWLDRRGAP